MRDLGQRQSELISTGEMASLLRLLSAKNQVIAAIQAIEKELDPFHAQDPEQRQWHSSQARVHCAQLAEECRLLLAEVMQMERDNEQKMTVRRDEVANQLQAARASSTARGAYQVHQMTTPQGPHAGVPGLEIAGGEQRLDIFSDT